MYSDLCRPAGLQRRHPLYQCFHTAVDSHGKREPTMRTFPGPADGRTEPLETKRRNRGSRPCSLFLPRLLPPPPHLPLSRPSISSPQTPLFTPSPPPSPREGATAGRRSSPSVIVGSDTRQPHQTPNRPTSSVDVEGNLWALTGVKTSNRATANPPSRPTKRVRLDPVSLSGVMNDRNTLIDGL